MIQEIKLFGLTFKPMVEMDFNAFAGADEGSFICYEDDNVYVLSPDRDSMAVVNFDGTEVLWERAER